MHATNEKHIKSTSNRTKRKDNSKSVPPVNCSPIFIALISLVYLPPPSTIKRQHQFTMGAFFSKPSESEHFSRVRFPIFNFDLITIRSASAYATAVRSGDIDRIGFYSLDDLPWLLRLYLPHTQLYSSKFETFSLPMRSKSSSSYPPCLSFMKDVFENDENFEFEELAKQAVDVLEKESTGDDDEETELKRIAARALFPKMFGHISDDIIDASMKQLTSPVQLLSSWLPSFHTKDIGKVFDFAQDKTKFEQENNSLPDEIISDVAHGIFIMSRNGALLLRQLYKNPDMDVMKVFQTLALSENTLRICVKDGRLGGLLKKEEGHEIAKAAHTAIMVDIKEIMNKEDDPFWAFAVDEDRECTAKRKIVEFALSVQKELRERRVTMTAS